MTQQLTSKILLVDDNPLNVELLSQELEDLNFEILTALSGEEAQALVMKEKPDLVLLDWMMPGMSGIDLLKLWRDDISTQSMPVIMVTAKTSSDDVVKGLRAGANDYVTKPIDFEILQARIFTHLRLHHMQEELRIKNEQMIRELNAARRMQLASLPDSVGVKKICDEFNIVCESYYEASTQLAGDYWDLIKQGDQITILIVDFAGHGVVPSINTFRFKTFLHSQCMNVKDPARILSMANEYFCRQLTEYDYATAAVCSYRPERGIIIYANAGHLPPVLLHKSTTKIEELPKGSYPIGLIPHAKYTSKKIKVESGDKLFLYTDGLIETWDSDGQMFGMGNLFRFLEEKKQSSASEIVNEVVTRVKQHCDHRSINDDITTFALEFLPYTKEDFSI